MGQISDFWGHFEKNMEQLSDILKICDISDISMCYHLYPAY